MASRRQVEANRRSGRLGGPKTPEGKAVSRLNARKHGIFASALTPMDHEELHGIHDRCRAELQPLGFLEEAIVDKIAAVYLSLQRCALAHAEYHLLTWKQHPCQADWPRRHPDDRFDLNYFETTVVLVQRYDTTLTNQFLRLIHELQALQQRRSPEANAAPRRQGCRASGNLPGEGPAALRNEPNTSQQPTSQEDTARPRTVPSPCESLPDTGPCPVPGQPAARATGALDSATTGDPAAPVFARGECRASQSSGAPCAHLTGDSLLCQPAALQNEPNPSHVPASQEDAEQPLDPARPCAEADGEGTVRPTDDLPTLPQYEPDPGPVAAEDGLRNEPSPLPATLQDTDCGSLTPGPAADTPKRSGTWLYGEEPEPDPPYAEGRVPGPGEAGFAIPEEPDKPVSPWNAPVPSWVRRNAGRKWEDIERDERLRARRMRGSDFL